MMALFACCFARILAYGLIDVGVGLLPPLVGLVFVWCLFLFGVVGCFFWFIDFSRASSFHVSVIF